MPIFTKKVKKDDTPDEQVNALGQDINDIQINDFSEDIDLSGLGDLLGGGIPNMPQSSEIPPIQPSAPKPEKQKLSDAFATLFKAVSDKFKGSKKRDEIPDLPGTGAAQDPNYISETVSFADSEQELEKLRADNAAPQDSPNNNAMNYGGFNGYETNDYASQPPELPVTYDVYSQPQQDLYQDFPQSMPQNTMSSMPSEPDDSPISADTPSAANPEIFAPQWPDFDDYSLPMDFAPQNNDNFDASADAGHQPQSPAEESEEEPVRRPHDIMGAVRARIEQFRKRLPSFKPKVYEMPKAQYNEKDDKLAKSPSLMADVEKYINHRSDMHEVSQEYERMRQYIQSVNTDSRLRPSDITPPENIHEVYSAQNELFDMINTIGMQNEQQRSRIGVYAPPEAEDPYNYRGINDERLNYTDIESASFSMSSGINFESEEKISPDRSFYMQQYDRLPQEEAQMDDDFGFDDGMQYADMSSDFGMDDDFENDFGGDFDNGSDNAFGNAFGNDFDDDFDDNRF